MQAGSPDRVDRRLVAILAADVVGYNRTARRHEPCPAAARSGPLR
jgi:class 3 adenylate cyclase